jgi:thermitase
MRIAADSLSRRILGLRWTVKPKGLFWSEEFEIWPEADNDVSDARLYRLSQMFTRDPWVVSVEPVLEGPDFQIPTGKEGFLPIDDPVWYLGPEGINAYEAWAMFEKKGKKPGQGILIGLPDTGYLEHPELFHDDGTTQLRLDLQRNFSESSKPSDARDYCDTLCGLTVNKTVKMAYVGHGTTTASLIISPPGRQPGTVGHLHTEGAAQHAEVIPIRVSPSVLMTPTAMSKLARGIDYAAEQGAKVISISMGGVTLSDSELLEAIRRAIAHGAIVVAAAGNTPYNNPTPWMNDVSKPASYEETIAVGGHTAYQTPWRDTSRGPEVDICAPAEDIRRARAGWVNMTEHVNDTDRSEGTSMSTALTAGVAALWLSYHGYDNLVEHYDNDPSKLQEAFREIITTTGNRRPTDWDTSRYGAGLLDAAKVLASPLPDLSSFVSANVQNTSRKGRYSRSGSMPDSTRKAPSRSASISRLPGYTVIPMGN